MGEWELGEFIGPEVGEFWILGEEFIGPCEGEFWRLGELEEFFGELEEFRKLGELEEFFGPGVGEFRELEEIEIL